MENISIKAKLILVLESKQDWVNKIPRKLPNKTRGSEKFLWIDKNGCVFETGADFASAERIESYPCNIYKLMSVSEFEDTEVPNE